MLKVLSIRDNTPLFLFTFSVFLIKFSSILIKNKLKLLTRVALILSFKIEPEC